MVFGEDSPWGTGSWGKGTQTGVGMMLDETSEDESHLKKFNKAFEDQNYEEANEVFKKLSQEEKDRAISENITNEKSNKINPDILKIDFDPNLKQKLIKTNEELNSENISNEKYLQILKQNRGSKLITDFIKESVEDAFGKGNVPLESAFESSSHPSDVLSMSEKKIMQNPQDNLSKVYKKFNSPKNIETMNCFALKEAWSAVNFQKAIQNAASRLDQKDHVTLVNMINASIEKLDSVDDTLLHYLTAARQNGLQPDSICRIRGHDMSVEEILNDLDDSGLFHSSLINKAKAEMGIKQENSAAGFTNQKSDQKTIHHSPCSGDMNQLLGLHRSGICDISAAIKMIDESMENTAKEKLKNLKPQQKQAQKLKQDPEVGFGNGRNIRVKENQTDCSMLSITKIFRNASAHGEMTTRVQFTIQHQIQPASHQWNEIIFNDIDLNELRKKLNE